MTKLRQSQTFPEGAAGSFLKVNATEDGWDYESLLSDGANSVTGLFVVEGYGAKGDRTPCVCSITSGSATPSSFSPSLTSDDVGKSVRIIGAGTSGAPLVTTIASVSGGVPTFAATASTTVSGKTGVYGTDDTTAWQDAINDAAAVNGTVVALSTKGYVLAGALQSTSTYNSILKIPQISSSGISDTTPPGTIAIVGVNVSPRGYYLTGAARPALGAVVEFLTPGTGHYPSGLAAGKADDTAFNFRQIVVRDLTFRTAPGQGLTSVNLGPADTCTVRGVTIDKAVPTADLTVPTVATDIGLWTPNNNNGASTEVEDCWIDGHYIGFMWNEHCNVDNLNFMHCKYAAQVNGAYHSSRAGRVGVYWCQYGLVFQGGSPNPHCLTVAELDIEHAPDASIWAPVVDVYDPNNYGQGKINWHAVKSAAGVDSNLYVGGGSNLRFERIWNGSTSTTATLAAPTGVSATAYNSSAKVSFSAVAGATSYTVTSSPGGLTATGPDTTLVVAGLTNGTAYTFTVTATDGTRTSAPSSASGSVTPGSSLGVFDDFNRAGSSTSLGTAPNGNAWSNLRNTWGITSRKAYSPAGSVDDIASVDTGLGDCTINLTLPTVWASTGGLGISFRMTDANNGYVADFNPNGANIFKLVGGSYTNIGAMSAHASAGDTVTVVLSGSSIVCKINGSTVASITDTTWNNTKTKHGLYNFSDTVSRADNFEVKP